MKLSDEHLIILRYMLGINTPDARRPRPYRDYYCAGKGDENLRELQRLGAVALYRTDDHYEWYTTTPSGRAAAMASHRAIRNSKAKRVYRRFLDIREVCPDLTFREFITNHQFADVRRDA